MMKTVVTTLLIAMTLGLNAKASSSDAQDIVNKLRALNGRTGQVASNIEKDSTGRCQLSVEDNDYGVSVTFEGTGLYFTPVAHIDENAAALDEGTLLVSTNGKRAGGDACGDWGGAINYKKTISVKQNVVTIEESFRCALEAFKKYRLISSCALK